MCFPVHFAYPGRITGKLTELHPSTILSRVATIIKIDLSTPSHANPGRMPNLFGGQNPRNSLTSKKKITTKLILTVD